MPKLPHILTLLTLSILAAITSEHWSGTTYELGFVILCIIVAGIPHGSLDHLVAGKRERNFRLIRYLILYILSSLIYLFCWWLVPGIAFLFFIIITAWHFGETDMASFHAGKSPVWAIAAYGFALTCWLLMQDHEAIVYWTNIITRKSYAASFIMSSISSLPPGLWLVMVALLLFSAGNGNRKLLVYKTLFMCFLLALSQTTLLTGFVLYFCGWHSMNALSHIKNFAFSHTGIKAMLLKAIPPTLAALLFLILVGALGNGNWLQHHGLPALFILLAILTLPHMTEMHRLYTLKTHEAVNE